jgi:hypothetical protein
MHAGMRNNEHAYTGSLQQGPESMSSMTFSGEGGGVGRGGRRGGEGEGERGGRGAHRRGSRLGMGETEAMGCEVRVC